MGKEIMSDVIFNPIKLNEWSRSQIFHYFSQIAPTGFSMTVQVNVTVMRDMLKARRIKFFPAYLWLITKMLNKQVEFRVAIKDEVLGYWNSLTPLHAVFHDDDKTISFMWTEYCDDFHEFYKRYLNNQAEYKDNHGFLSQPHQMPPQNTYTVSCLPWIGFQHFAIHSFESKPYYLPTIEAGKFIQNEQTVIMPLSITAHHATTDGWHIKRFLDDLQGAMDCPEEWV
jgi:chloramphenicol O-acetyltransferase type A